MNNSYQLQNNNLNENEYNNLLNRMNYLTINDSNFNNNTNNNKQPQNSQIQTQQQNIVYDSMNDMVMGDYCECETTMFRNGYFSSSIYR
ncbi:hypothetical protein BCR32DRAFT_293025 [Anaeromyces robustus]|uniref:Uncharacterized protein n=1 Tax=Anaeromyces robustus TaxID=1754192 RepID=A0A1Y1X7Y3_9FUNG|nr:hypothetical protein BCR32DRAFT_293025 [Anaeromyces robustus]|eukprot:ORX81859.1 hypothetical protein BCR32DRAFT_293025 [Anaeromyces robustus]